MSFDRLQLQDLCEMSVEGRLTSETFEELKSVVLSNDEALEYYVDYLYNHASLSYRIRDEGSAVDAMRNLFGTESPRDLMEFRQSLQQSLDSLAIPLRRISDHRGSWLRPLTAVCILLLLGLLGVLLRNVAVAKPEQTRHFASLAKTTNCLWGDSMTMTRPGTRLGPCTLRLEEGVALVHFDCGVAISLEGPCVFELREEKQAFLHFGCLVATVESVEGIGFLIDTPNAIIKDFGTKFGINSPKDRPTSVYVIEGNVEVQSKKTPEQVSLQRGEAVVLGRQKDEAGSTPLKVEPFMSVFQISTATGRGKEQWVVCEPSVLHSAEIGFPEADTRSYMLVKTSTLKDRMSDRKAVFSIDIGQVNEQEKQRIDDAILTLSYGPTGLGYFSNVSDSDFTLYGLLDESQDGWNSDELDWETLPGNLPRNEMDENVWIPLGHFSIAQGSLQGLVSVEGKKLIDFIHNDSNGLLTFALVRNTVATEVCGYVHGFANRHHNKLMPPNLKMTFHESNVDRAPTTMKKNKPEDPPSARKNNK